MSFNVGDTIGPYKIVAHVGQGGMATIYKAYQTTLDRYVALKIIHPALKGDRSFVMRLQREATVIAKLSHPNIVAVHDFREHEGIPFLVLQFVEGKTLKEVLKEQKLNKQQILNIIRPVADALTYAHSRGVLHRDVKPSNILIDPEGYVYLTDFGLARIAQSGESTASQDMMIGSPHYLSPEQAKSEPVDTRTDIYSLGIILYEMFAGRVPFSAETTYATILAQINDPPPAPRSINPKVPRAVEQVLLKALAKNPKERFASVREMMRALENAVRGPREEDDPAAPIPLIEYKPAREGGLPRVFQRGGEKTKTPPAGTPRAAKSRAWMPFTVALGAVLVLLACIGIAWFALVPALLGAPTPPRVTLTTPTRVAVAVPSVTAANVVAPTAVITPVQSPTRALPTATPTALVSTPTNAPPPPAVIALRGKIAYSVATGDAAENHNIYLADADGTDAKLIIEFGMWPAISPEGSRIAYYRMKDEGIYIANIDGGAPRKIVPGETCCAQWSPDGKRLVYLQGKLKAGDTKVFLINSDGTGKTELVPGFSPAWSPDGSRLAYTACQPNTTQCGLHVYDFNSNKSTMITRDDGKTPRWSPRGDKIVYSADSGQGHIDLFVINPEGSGRAQLTSGRGKNTQAVWSLDGNYIYYRSDQDGKVWGIFVMRADGSAQRLLMNNVAPDGERWPFETLSIGP